MFDVNKFIEESKRIITIAKKPSRQEFSSMAKATGIGIIVIAAIGFVVFLVKALFFPSL